MTSSTEAELASITDAVSRCRQRISDLAEPYVGSKRDDILAALYEVERSLLGAERSLQRASRTVDGAT